MTTFADINAGPTVVIGAETNQWHAEMTKATRYAVTKFKSVSMVLDAQTNQPLCEKPHFRDREPTFDCGVVTRLMKSSAKHPLLLVSGLNHYSTYTLGDLLVTPALLDPVLIDLPARWQPRDRDTRRTCSRWRVESEVDGNSHLVDGLGGVKRANRE